jgi:hypothetical protein
VLKVSQAPSCFTLRRLDMRSKSAIWSEQCAGHSGIERIVAKIILMQTADPHLYSEMLWWTSVPNKLYAWRLGIEYQAFLGLKRGYFSWHACFNRLILLHDLLQRRYDGWVFYLDADAYVYDLGFDLHTYIGNLDGKIAMVAGPGGIEGHAWDINTGVFLINLGQRSGQEIISLWYDDFMSVSEEDLRNQSEWGMDDQKRLHRVLQNHGELIEAIKIEQREFFNDYHASFVRQVLTDHSHGRSFIFGVKHRTALIADQVRDLLALRDLGNPFHVEEKPPSIADVLFRSAQAISQANRLTQAVGVHMILFSLGIPGRFARWCDAVVARLAHHCVGSTEVVSLNTLEELALALIRTGAMHFVICSLQPTGALLNAIAQMNKKFIVALDDPRFAVEDILANDGIPDPIEATRIVARSCASITNSMKTSGALVLRASEAGRNLSATVEAIARHFELPITQEHVEDILNSMCFLPLALEREFNEPSSYRSDRLRQAYINSALGAYANFFKNRELGSITWERDLFYIDAGSHAEPAIHPVDITGRPRALVFGPYVNLPAGSWSANVTLGFSPEAADVSYYVEVFAGHQLTHVEIAPSNERFVEVNLRFSVDMALDHPLEIRVWNQRAAFDGRLALGYVTLTPQTYVREVTQEYFSRL